MNKVFCSIGLFLAFNALQAQPLPYYQDAYNEDGEDLREALYDIIKVHTRLQYSSSSTDTWDVLKVSDKDTTNTSNVCLIYAGVSVNGPQEYNNGQGWNREHVWPQSLGGFNTSAGVGTDVHNLKPADGGLNSLRSNHEYDDLGSGGSAVNYNGSATGNRVNGSAKLFEPRDKVKGDLARDDLGSSGSAVNYNGSATGNRVNGSAKLFEPRDKVKGDLARIILYMDLRYEGAGGEPDLVVQESLNSGGTTFAVLSTLIAWHWADPVDSFEMNRNNVIHNMQGNRNPFIDHPELVHYIYGDSTHVAWNPYMAVHEQGPIHLKIGPNPADSFLNITTTEASDFQIFTLGKHLVDEGTLKAGENKLPVNHLPSATYYMLVGDRMEKIIIQH